MVGASGAAEIPASVPLVVSLDTSFDSKATDELLRLADRFPGKAELYARARRELSKQGLDFETDVKPALGPDRSRAARLPRRPGERGRPDEAA